MRAAKSLFFLMCLLTTSAALAAVSPSQLTEQSVRQLLAKVDKAVADRDVDLLGQTLSDNVEITATISANGQTQTVTMGKTQYLESARATWAAVSSHTYTRSNERIVITGNVATVTADVVETSVINGQLIRSQSHEKAIVQLVNGVPQATKITAHSTVSL